MVRRGRPYTRMTREQIVAALRGPAASGMIVDGPELVARDRGVPAEMNSRTGEVVVGHRPAGRRLAYEAALPYVDPTVAQQQARQRFGVTEAQRRAAAYGARQLALLRQIAPQLAAGSDLRVAAESRFDDPAAGWRAASRFLAPAASAAGYADPRLFLAALLRQRGGGGGRVAAL